MSCGPEDPLLLPLLPPTPHRLADVGTGGGVPGLPVAIARPDVAVVDIDYTQTTYSIKYNESTNLDYDGEKIHKNYNGWIQNLDKAIKVQLQNL